METLIISLIVIFICYQIIIKPFFIKPFQEGLGEKENKEGKRVRQEKESKHDIERKEDKHDTENQVKCPNCGSKSIHADKKGFSGGNACCGALLAGPLGLLCGTSGQNKIVVTCLNCKHTW